MSHATAAVTARAAAVAAVIFISLAAPMSAQQAAAPAPSQSAQATVDPGMSKAQVIERFGKPAIERSRGTFTYLFYSNGMEKNVGMSDVVVLDGDKVIDAVLRSPRRAYSGTSSSPKAISPQEAAKGKPTGPVTVPPTE
jgi:outer membrane protein assembly factor BamE (lipoprotein component of BamABCDE complex)